MTYEFKTSAKDLANAILSEPEGQTCGWCQGPNTFADDCGFFYITPRAGDTRPTCRECYDGPEGDLHRHRYGVGER